MAGEDNPVRAPIEELAAATLAAVAPEESVLFRRTSARYFEDPDRFLAESSASRDEPLGFGVDIVVQLAAPAALAAATDVVLYLIDRLKKRFADEAADTIYGRLRGLFRRTSSTDDDVERVVLTGDEVAHVRSIAIEKARALGLEDERAILLGDAMAGSLLSQAA